MGQETWEELGQQQGGGFTSLVRVGWMQIWPMKPWALCVACFCPFTSWPCPALPCPPQGLGCWVHELQLGRTTSYLALKMLFKAFSNATSSLNFSRSQSNLTSTASTQEGNHSNSKTHEVGIQRAEWLPQGREERISKECLRMASGDIPRWEAQVEN